LSQLALGSQIGEHFVKGDKIIGFLHRQPFSQEVFVEISTHEGVLQATPGHLIFVKKQGNEQFMFAKDINIGDQLCKISGENTIWADVLDARSVVNQGVYAPLSESGCLIVNGFVVSCYAEFASHDVAHTAFALLRLKNKFFPATEPCEGIHPYAKFFMKTVGIK